MGKPSIPETRREMRKARYEFIASRKCNACPARIEFWKTTHGKTMIFDAIEGDDTPVVSHFKTCPKADQFTKAKPGMAPAPAADPNTPAGGRDPKTIEQQLRSLQSRFRARAVVLIDDQGTIATWRNGLPAEELRTDLISAANFVRNEISKGDTTL
jgi:hypothetical protein